MMWQARIIAYDCIDRVEWTVHVWDLDEARERGSSSVYDATGAMQGRGSESPTKWLRELLEELREHM